MLSSLIYTSEVADLGQGGIQHLLEQARANNAERSITGLLLFNRHHFLQYLEGGRRQLTELFGDIARDPRHTNVELVVFQDLAVRVVPDWSMGYLASTSALREIYQRFFSVAEFEPGALTTATATAFVHSLLAHYHKADGDLATTVNVA